MNGFNVMVGVSYTAPYDSTCVPACAAKFPVDTDNIWKQILADPNVDIFSPQFYLGGSKALIIQTSGSSIDFKTWEDTVRDGAQIIPSLKVHGDSLAAQVQQMNDFCAGGHPRFCESGGYILWSSN